jgi:hypothetical protein
MKNIQEKVKKLPPDLQHEVEDFVEFLLDRAKSSKTKKMRLTWAGGLKSFRDQYTSLELQKKALRWWVD